MEVDPVGRLGEADGLELLGGGKDLSRWMLEATITTAIEVRFLLALHNDHWYRYMAVTYSDVQKMKSYLPEMSCGFGTVSSRSLRQVGGLDAHHHGPRERQRRDAPHGRQELQDGKRLLVVVGEPGHLGLVPRRLEEATSQARQLFSLNWSYSHQKLT